MVGMATSGITPSERVACWFKLRGWSLQDAAEATGLHRQKLWRIVTGKQPPKGEELELIAERLGLTMAQFYGDPEAPAGGEAANG